MSANVFPDLVYPATDPGLTKRELFAAMAMQGMAEMATLRRLETDDPDETRAGWAARQAVVMADALLAALAKEPAK